MACRVVSETASSSRPAGAGASNESMFNVDVPVVAPACVTLTGHQGGISALLVTTSGLLVSGGSDGTVRVWDVDHERGKGSMRCGYNPKRSSRVSDLVELDDGRIVAGLGDGTVFVLVLKQEAGPEGSDAASSKWKLGVQVALQAVKDCNPPEKDRTMEAWKGVRSMCKVPGIENMIVVSGWSGESIKLVLSPDGTPSQHNIMQDISPISHAAALPLRPYADKRVVCSMNHAGQVNCIWPMLDMYNTPDIATMCMTSCILEADPPPPPADGTVEASPSTTAPGDLGPRGVDADGKVLVAGDKVEAKWQGQGHRTFRGRIIAVHVVDGVATFDIDFDDGDQESGVISKNVYRRGRSKADAEAAAASGAGGGADAGTAAPTAEESDDSDDDESSSSSSDASANSWRGRNNQNDRRNRSCNRMVLLTAGDADGNIVLSDLFLPSAWPRRYPKYPKYAPVSCGPEVQWIRGLVQLPRNSCVRVLGAAPRCGDGAADVPSESASFTPDTRLVACGVSTDAILMFAFEVPWDPSQPQAAATCASRLVARLRGAGAGQTERLVIQKGKLVTAGPSGNVCVWNWPPKLEATVYRPVLIWCREAMARRKAEWMQSSQLAAVGTAGDEAGADDDGDGGSSSKRSRLEAEDLKLQALLGMVTQKLSLDLFKKLLSFL